MAKEVWQMEDLIKVNLLDEEIGYASKEACHSSPILHRAFSIFLHDGQRMLIQRRALEKYHSGGLWTNACCSHPHKGERIRESVSARLMEELGVVCPCEEEFAFPYFHKFHDGLYEYEFDHVWIGRYAGTVSWNPQEVMDAKWIDFDALIEDVSLYPERYAVWFIIALPKVLEIIRRNNSAPFADGGCHERNR